MQTEQAGTQAFSELSAIPARDSLPFHVPTQSSALAGRGTTSIVDVVGGQALESDDIVSGVHVEDFAGQAAGSLT